MVTRLFTLLTALTAGAIVLSACSDATGPHDEGRFRGREYLWESGSGLRQFTVLRGGMQYRHLLRFSSEGKLEDLQTDEQSHPLARTHWNFSGSGGRISGCGEHTLWHLPGEYRLEEIRFPVPGPEVRGSSILSLDASNYLVGCVDSGLYHYSSTRSEWYRMDFPGRGSIVAMCKDSTAGNMTLFAASADGVYSKARNDSGWNRLPVPAGSVQDLEISDPDYLFAVIDHSLWFSARPFLSWSRFMVQPGDGQINDIAILPLEKNQSLLLVATETKGIAYVQLVNSLPAQLVYSERSGYENVRCLVTSPRAPYAAVAISNPPLLFVAPGTGVWIGIPVPTSATLTCVAQSAMTGTVLVGSDQGIYRFNGQPPQASGLQGRMIRALHAGPDNAFYAACDDGFYRSPDEGATWTRIDGGSILARGTTPWQILPVSFDVGSTWHAATLSRTDGTTIAVTGEVLNHFDEIILPDERGRYDDAVVVRFTLGRVPGAGSGNDYTWTVYFVRGKGIVCIEETSGGSIVAKSYLDNF